MTNVYEGISNKELLRDPTLILMVESTRYCEQNNVKDIKYAELRRLCNNKLAELTNNERSEFGGSFEAYLKRLADPEESPDKRVFTRVRSEVTRKDSKIIPNIPLIKILLDKKRVINSITDMIAVTNTNVTKQVTYTARIVDSYVQISERIESRVIRANCNDFIKDACKGISLVLGSNPISTQIYSQDNNNKFQINEEANHKLSELYKVLHKKTRTNPLSSLLNTKEYLVMLMILKHRKNILNSFKR